MPVPTYDQFIESVLRYLWPTFFETIVLDSGCDCEGGLKVKRRTGDA